MNSRVFKPILLHGTMAAIGLAAAACGNYLSNLPVSAVKSGENQAEQSFGPIIDALRHPHRAKTLREQAQRVEREGKVTERVS